MRSRLPSPPDSPEGPPEGASPPPGRLAVGPPSKELPSKELPSKELPSKEPGSGCKEFEWMVGPLVDGELPAAEAQEVERHLRACPTCSSLAEEFRSLDRLAHRMEPPPAVSAAEWDQVWELVRREPKVVHLEVLRGALDWLVPALSLAALVLLLAWVAFAVATRSPRLDPKAVDILKGAPEELHPSLEKKKAGRSS
jgi:hypothetical protein